MTTRIPRQCCYTITAGRGHYDLEWGQVIRDLDRVECIEVAKNGQRFRLRSEAAGTSGKVFQAAGVALPPTLQAVNGAAP